MTDEELKNAAEDFVWEVMENDEDGISDLCRKLRPTSKISDFYDALAEFFIAGAKWQKEQMPLPEDTVLFNKGVEEGKRLMMEEAVECELYYDGDFLAIDLNMAELGYSERDKVRVIILPKEDDR